MYCTTIKYVRPNTNLGGIVLCSNNDVQKKISYLATFDLNPPLTFLVVTVRPTHSSKLSLRFRQHGYVTTAGPYNKHDTQLLQSNMTFFGNCSMLTLHCPAIKHWSILDIFTREAHRTHSDSKAFTKQAENIFMVLPYTSKYRCI